MIDVPGAIEILLLQKFQKKWAKIKLWPGTVE
jgi:hypothetical protein